jgi:acetyltransferase-like isoleucine patch superfamily enzyme
MAEAKREVERFWDKRGENSLRRWHKVRNPITVSRNFLLIWLAKYAPSLRLKRGLYRMSGMKVGRGVSVGIGAVFDLFFPELIEIGDNTIIGYDTLVLSHEFLQDEWRKGRVRIGKDVMVGARSIVMPGVTIGDGAKVASYSLVNRDVKPGEFVGGIPIKSL